MAYPGYQRKLVISFLSKLNHDLARRPVAVHGWNVLREPTGSGLTPHLLSIEQHGGRGGEMVWA